MPAPPPKPKPGLKAVHDHREQRATGKYSRPTEKMWLAMGASLALILGGYWFFASRKLEGQKSALLAKRNADEATLGAEWFPLRDKMEKAIVAEGREAYGADFVDPAAKGFDLDKRPGIYLRIRLAEAKDEKSIRKAAQDAMKDGFVGCLVVSPTPELAKGAPEAGVFGEQPWNLRQAYASTRILTEEWVNEVRESSDALRLRVFQQQYDKASTEEVPLAAKIVKQADYFLFVLDEDDEAARAYTDGGALTSEALQTVPHHARVALLDLHQNKVLLRVRRRPEASFRMMGEGAVTDPETIGAMQRQVNNCQLANEVKAVLGR